jgi:hypothetical protein
LKSLLDRLTSFGADVDVKVRINLKGSDEYTFRVYAPNAYRVFDEIVLDHMSNFGISHERPLKVQEEGFLVPVPIYVVEHLTDTYGLFRLHTAYSDFEIV